jgi:hypothetical protein
MGMEVHEDFECGFERDKSDHDPFELMAVAPLLRAFKRFDALSVMVKTVVNQLESLVNQIVIHDA